jgi:phosphoribosylamine--glycine ligase
MRDSDPETQSYMRLLKTDLLDILNACVDSTLAKLDITWSDQTAVCIVMASGGYPEKYNTGLPITGLDAAAKLPDIVIFHAGTSHENNRILTAGGRVLGVTAVGKDLAQARSKAYAAVKLIQFSGQQYRTDIGNKSLPGG